METLKVLLGLKSAILIFILLLLALCNCIVFFFHLPVTKIAVWISIADLLISFSVVDTLYLIPSYFPLIFNDKNSIVGTLVYFVQ